MSHPRFRLRAVCELRLAVTPISSSSSCSLLVAHTSHRTLFSPHFTASVIFLFFFLFPDLFVSALQLSEIVLTTMASQWDMDYEDHCIGLILARDCHRAFSLLLLTTATS